MSFDEEPTLGSVSARLARLESRLVQLMMHLGLHPNKKTYEQTSNSIRRRTDENVFPQDRR